MFVTGSLSLSQLAARQPKFHWWLFIFLGLVVTASSFLATDKRGLLTFEPPVALAVEQQPDLPPMFVAGFGGTSPALARRPGRARRISRAAGVGSPPSGASEAAPFVGAGTGSQVDAPGPGPGIAPPQASGAVQTALNQSVSTLALPPFGNSGIGSGPIGPVVLQSPVPPGTGGGDTGGGDGDTGGGDGDTGGGAPDPVVPAIPEPESWLMMIIGLFGLGMMLRRQADRNSLGAPARG